MEGWLRLKSQGGLTGTKSTEENRLDYLKRSNPLQYFVYQFCRPDPEARATVAAVYDCYKRVAIKLGKVPITKSWFGTRLLETLDHVEGRQTKISGKNTRIYAGLRIDLELLSEELGNSEHGKAKYQGVVFENSIMMCNNGVFGGTDPSQKKLTSDGDSPRPQPPLPDPSLYEIWSSRDLDYGLSIDFATLKDREKDTLTKGTELEYTKNNPKGEYGPNTYSLTAKGLNACEGGATT